MVRALLVLPFVLAENPYLEQARENLRRFEYSRCLQRLEQAGGWKANTGSELVDIELTAGLCEANLGRDDAAVEHFAMAMKLNPLAELPPRTSPKIHELFKRAAKTRPVVVAIVVDAGVEPFDAGLAVVEAEEPDAGVVVPVEQVVAAPPTDAGVTPPARHLPVISLVFGGLAAAGLVLGIAEGVSASGNLRLAGTAEFASDRAAALQRARDQATVANVSFGTAGAFLLAGVVLFFLLGSL